MSKINHDIITGPETVPILNADGTFTVLVNVWSPDYSIMNEKLGTSRRL